MADITLKRPTAGQVANITPAAEDRLVFDFNSSEATLTREDDNLIMTFGEGDQTSTLTLTDFYTAYTSENMPTFIIGGEEVRGEDFFAVLGEDLMPAAGSPNSPQGGGTTVGTVSAELFESAIESLSSDESIGFVITAQEPFLTGVVDNPAPVLEGVTLFAGSPASDEGNPNLAPTVGEGDYAPLKEHGVGTESDPNAVVMGIASFSGQINVSDPGDTLTFALTSPAVGTYGTISFNDNGTFSYVLSNTNAATNALGLGDVGREQFSGTVTDSAGNVTPFSFAFSIQGTNDAPVFTMSDLNTEYSAVLSKAIPYMQGEFAWTDADAGSVTAVSLSSIGGQAVNWEGNTASIVLNGIELTLRITSSGKVSAKNGDVEYFSLVFPVNENAETGENTVNWKIKQHSDLGNDAFDLKFTVTDEHNATDTHTVTIDPVKMLTLQQALDKDFSQKAQNIIVEKTQYFDAAKDEKEIVQLGKADDVVHLRAEHAMHSVGSRGDSLNKLVTASGDDIVSINTDNTAMYANTKSDSDMYSATNIVDTGSGEDTVNIITAEGSGMLAGGVNALNKIDTGSGADSVSIVVGDEQHALRASNGGENKISLGKGDDYLHLEGKVAALDDGRNILNGGKGEDTLSLENAQKNDTYTLTGKADEFAIEGVAEVNKFEKLEFGDANDIVDASSIKKGSMDIDGGAGDDILTGGFGADTLLGGLGDDIIFGDLNDLKLHGGDGNDLIVLPDIDDVLQMDIDGGEGIDILLAGIDSSLEADRLLSSANVKNIDIFMYGDEDTAKDLQGKFDNLAEELIADDWIAGNEYTGANNANYREYTSKDDEMTILVNTSLLGNNQS